MCTAKPSGFVPPDSMRFSSFLSSGGSIWSVKSLVRAARTHPVFIAGRGWCSSSSDSRTCRPFSAKPRAIPPRFGWWVPIIRRRAAWAATAARRSTPVRLDKILEFGETFVRAQAGVRVGTLVHALAERGLELPLTPEMGQISLGALAVTTLPQASYGAGRRAALLLRHGNQADHAAGQADDRHRAGTRPDARAALELWPVGRRARGRASRAAADAGQNRLSGAVAQGIQRAASPRSSERPAHCVCTSRRSTTGSRSNAARSTNRRPLSRSGIWQIRNSVMRNVLPAFGSTVGSVLAAPGLRAVMQKALRATIDRSTRGRNDVCA